MNINCDCHCGTAIDATSMGEGVKMYGIRLGTVTLLNELLPTLQTEFNSARSWLKHRHNRPSFA